MGETSKRVRQLVVGETHGRETPGGQPSERVRHLVGGETPGGGNHWSLRHLLGGETPAA